VQCIGGEQGEPLLLRKVLEQASEGVQLAEGVST